MPFDAEQHLDHLAEIMGLEIRPEWRAGVAANLAVTAAMAALVLNVPLPDEVEPAPVFSA